MSLGFAAFTYFMFDFFILSNYRNAKRCTKKPKELLSDIPMLFINGISLPVVEYTVDRNQYKVVGPKFLSDISNTISTPLGSIVSDVKMDNFENGEIPQVLRYKVKGNSFLSYTKSPLKERFPIGGKAAIYYDSNKPKRAYVERSLKPGRYAWLTKCAVYLLVFMMIAMAFFIVFILPNLMN